MLVMEIWLFFIFIATYLANAEDCPKFCPKFEANAKCGKVAMMIFYDNDEKGSADQSDTNIVKYACDALDMFKDKLSVEFKIGAKTKKDPKTNELHCPADCSEDRWEACAAMHMDKDKFTQFVCCNNLGGSVLGCALQQGVKEATMQECYDQKKSDQRLLDVAKEREELKIQDCWLPQVLFNWKVSRCIEINSSEDLQDILCGMFDDADIPVDCC